MRERKCSTREERKLEWRVARVMMMTAAICVALAAAGLHATLAAPAEGVYTSEAPAASERILEAIVEVQETAVPEAAEPEATPLLHTEQELEMLAMVIYQEAGGDACSDECRQMVGEVVLNRVADPRFPDTIYEVISAPYQYGRLHWRFDWPERAKNPAEDHAVLRAYHIAAKLLTDSVERLLPEDVVFQAEFPQGDKTVAHLDGLYFCR